jgi:hypothetical protein
MIMETREGCNHDLAVLEYIIHSFLEYFVSCNHFLGFQDIVIMTGTLFSHIHDIIFVSIPMFSGIHEEFNEGSFDHVHSKF